MKVAHNFRDSLSMSHAASDLPIWEEVYRKAFPEMVAMIDHRQDGEHQRAGIDRSVILANSKQILIDEKVRDKAYPDVLIEFVSNDQTGSPGWAEKSLRCDFIAYCKKPKKVCFMLPVIQFQTAWRKNKDQWLYEYGFKSAENTDSNGRFLYNTLSCPVPDNILFPAIGQCLRVNW